MATDCDKKKSNMKWKAN